MIPLYVRECRWLSEKKYLWIDWDRNDILLRLRIVGHFRHKAVITMTCPKHLIPTKIVTKDMPRPKTSASVDMIKNVIDRVFSSSSFLRCIVMMVSSGDLLLLYLSPATLKSWVWVLTFALFFLSYSFPHFHPLKSVEHYSWGPSLMSRSSTYEVKSQKMNP